MQDAEILAELRNIHERLDKGAEKIAEIAFAGKETAKAAKQMCERLGSTIERVSALEAARVASAHSAAVRDAEIRGRASVGAIITRRQLALIASIVAGAVPIGGLALKWLEAIG